jgi:hypothetical protein
VLRALLAVWLFQKFCFFMDCPRNWNDSSEVDLKEPRLEGTNLIHLFQGWNQWRVSVNIIKLGVP